MRLVLLTVLMTCLCEAVPAQAQQPPSTSTGPLPPGFQLGSCVLNTVDPGHWRCEGEVEIELRDGTKFFADELDFYLETNLLEASGNVVFQGPEGQIAAERVEFNVEDGTGTFHIASGFISLGETADRTQFGNQDPDYIFTGETIEKLGGRRYRITRGTITACVQPTPRWQLVLDTLTLNLDDYAIARNAVLRVKGVPLMYLPVIYYPIQEDERATGFLMPTYGTSTLRGQALSNAFFWAIGRSHDATFFHDWYTKAGQGTGAEYRYILAPQSSGNFRMYRFARDETEYIEDDTVTVLPKNTSFELRGVATHAFSRTIRGRARVDYASDLFSQQLYHQDIYQASRRTRLIEGGITAPVGPLSTAVSYTRNELIQSATSTRVYGSTPRVTANLAPRRLNLFTAPLYASMNSEYAYLPFRTVENDVVTRDDSLNRMDVTPTLRVPLSSLPWLSLNTSASYRATYFTRQRDDQTDQTIGEGYLRDYMALRSEIVGPVFTRVWELPDSTFAERMKHVIEPAFTVDFTSAIDDYLRAPALSDPSDVVVGSTTSVTYGLTNRFFYRGRPVNGSRGQTREFITVGLQQTYYSNPEASQFDQTYRAPQLGSSRLVDLSPVAVNVRVSPTTSLDATGRLEYDVSGRGLQVVTGGGNLNFGNASANLNYSRSRRDRTSDADDYLSASTTLRLLQGRATGRYGLSWDISRGYVVSQNIVASYMAQCCGLQMEYQTYNVPRSTGIPVSSDRRFNFGFVLAGLGTFSNFFGAFGGQ
jgi:LPS-assembly protein